MTNYYECVAYGERWSWCQCCVWPCRKHIDHGICDSKPIVSDASIRVDRRKSPTNQPNVRCCHGSQRPWGHGLTTKPRYTSIALPKPCCIPLWGGSDVHLASSESFGYSFRIVHVNTQTSCIPELAPSPVPTMNCWNVWASIMNRALSYPVLVLSGILLLVITCIAGNVLFD